MKDLCHLPNGLRDPNRVMRLSQMGVMYPTRMSFLRTLLRNLIAEKSTVSETFWNMDEDGYGQTVFTIELGGQPYSLFAITQPIDPEFRTDRVIADRWDAAFVLYDGIPDAGERARLAENAPRQEGGRYSQKDLCISRANKSVRLFDTIVTALRDGTDLPIDDIVRTGYLMRTTAVYGNGKFGIADRRDIENRPGLSGPFMAEMLTVWLIRHFTHRLIEHVGGADLPIAIKKFLGIGNSTGLGMAPFLVSHPLLLHSWMASRETALAQVLSTKVQTDQANKLVELIARVSAHLIEWNVPDPEAQAAIEATRSGWAELTDDLDVDALMHPDALANLQDKAAKISPELEELAIAWMLEPFGDLVDPITECMANPFEPELDGQMDCADVQAIIENHWPEIADLDFSDLKTTAQFWYVSEAKLEPRIGQRHEEPGADQESPLDIARRVRALSDDLDGQTGPIWKFLTRNPHHRFAVCRMQALSRNPYSEIRDNLIDADTAPIDMLRCKLSFFGAGKFDPKSKLWTRITLMSGAPLASELADGTANDDFWMPVFAS